MYGLLVREALLCKGNCAAKRLHQKSVEQVRCEAQAAAAGRLIKYLTAEEEAILRRGRNAHPAHTPKNSSLADYHMATGVETLFGYLYLKGEIARLRELFAIACTEEDEQA